ncbi:MAG: phosphatidylglycerol lysyltransferase domain-containing protein [bacterium]
MRPIPQFPIFETVSLEHKAAVEVFTHAHPPYSDFNFTSLWAWDISGKRMVSQLNGNLVVRFTDYSTDEPFLSFLGTNEIEHTARTLIDYCKANGLPTILKLVPEISTQGMRPSVLKIEEDRDNFDYIYSMQEQSALKGGDFKRSRNFVKRFKESYPETRVEVVDLSNTDAQQNIITVLRAWEENKVLEERGYEIEHEETAIRHLFETSETHQLLVMGVFDADGGMVAFSIDETLPNQYCVGHFWKADVARVGVYDFLLNEKAKHLETLGVALLNYEQDLGIPGLRQSKMGYRPVSFLKKYEVSLRDE